MLIIVNVRNTRNIIYLNSYAMILWIPCEIFVKNRLQLFLDQISHKIQSSESFFKSMKWNNILFEEYD